MLYSLWARVVDCARYFSFLCPLLANYKHRPRILVSRGLADLLIDLLGVFAWAHCQCILRS